MWDGVRIGVSESLSSVHPTVTSDQCVWTQVHSGVVPICSDQQVYDRCIVVGFVTRWKEDFVSMIYRNFEFFFWVGGIKPNFKHIKDEFRMFKKFLN